MPLPRIRSQQKGRRGGFTLLELIVVITIIGLLGSIVVVRLTGTSVEARKLRVKSDCDNVLKVAESLYNFTGRYPETIQEMVNAKNEDGSPAIATLEKMPVDPWGNEYTYEIVNGRPQVTCYGSDKSPGGTDGETKDTIFPEPEQGY